MIFEKDRLNSGSKKNPHVFIWSANYKEGSIYKPEKFSGIVCRGRFHHTALIHRVDITLFGEYQTYGANFVNNLTKSLVSPIL